MPVTVFVFRSVRFFFAAVPLFAAAAFARPDFGFAVAVAREVLAFEALPAVDLRFFGCGFFFVADFALVALVALAVLVDRFDLCDGATRVDRPNSGWGWCVPYMKWVFSNAFIWECGGMLDPKEVGMVIS